MVMRNEDLSSALHGFEMFGEDPAFPESWQRALCSRPDQIYAGPAPDDDLSYRRIVSNEGHSYIFC